MSKEATPKMQTILDDQKMMQQILATHSPYTSLVVDENALLSIAHNILHQCISTVVVDPRADSKVPEDKTRQAISEELALIIHKAGCELSGNYSGEGDVKTITLAVFNLLVKYSWEAKVVLVLSAFAVSFGEFCLLSQQHATNPLAKSVIILKPLPDISERESLIHSLLKVVVDVTKCIISLTSLPSQYISRDQSPLSEAVKYIPNAVYWAVKSIVACASESIGLINADHEYLTSIAEVRKKLTDLTQKIKNIYEQLTHQLDLCHKHIDEQKSNESYNNLKRVMESDHEENVEILKVLIQTNDDQPLFDGVNKKRVSLDVLKGKTLIMFISYFDISDEEIKDITQKIEKPNKQYDVVWLPIIDKSINSTEIKQEITQKANLMPCYSLDQSLSLQPTVIKYIKEVLHFEKKPLLVVLNAEGKVVNPDAYHIIMIWGSDAFPFDTQREETLWKKTTWSLDFLVDGIDSNKEIWEKEGSFICLYGGEDIEWIKNINSSLKEVAAGAGLTIEMIYVGKKHLATIKKENISNYWDDQQKIKQFRCRLESIWYSKMKQGQSIENDPIMKDITLLLCSDGSGQGWTIIGQGANDLVVAKGNVVLECLSQFQTLKVNIPGESFISTLKKGIKEVQKCMSKDPKHKHCNDLVLPNTNGIIQENMVCIDCSRPMEKYVMFKCCIE